MSISVRQLINDINLLIQNGAHVLNVIKKPYILVKALEDLDKIIELNDVKELIIQQIQILLVWSYYHKDVPSKKFKIHELHTLIMGPPGVGKTKIAYILARIWDGLGILDELEREDEIVEDVSLELANEASSVLRSSKEIFALINELKSVYVPSVEMTFQNIQAKLRNETVDVKTEMLNGISESTLDTWNKITTLCKVLNTTAACIINASRPRDVEDSPSSTSSESYDPVCFASRETLVGAYQGHTAPKVREFFNKSKGKVVILDECYDMWHDHQDHFGAEALTMINTDMTEGKSRIYIFAGYEKLIQRTIFAAQPGLKRRFFNKIIINGYTADGLSKIFMDQITDKELVLCKQINLENFFHQHMTEFPAFGGDTLNLSKQCHICFGANAYKCLFNNMINDSNMTISLTITEDLLKQAFVLYRNNRVKDEEMSPPPPGMYG